jgi:hypothetical protein
MGEKIGGDVLGRKKLYPPTTFTRKGRKSMSRREREEAFFAKLQEATLALQEKYNIPAERVRDFLDATRKTWI